MENYSLIRNSQGSEQTSSKRTEYKQIRLDFGGGDGTRKIVPEKKKRTKTTNVRFFDDEDSEFTLPKNITNDELIQYLKIELMNIEHKMDQLMIRKAKILELIHGAVEDMSSKLDAMKYEHIELNELSITKEALKTFGSNIPPEKENEYSNSIINLCAYNFDGVNYSLFPMADSDIKDEPFTEENLIVPFLRTNQVPGVSLTNHQLTNEVKRLNNVDAMEITDLQELGNQYGIKSSDQQVLRKCLEEIKEFYQNKKIPSEYLNGYNLEQASAFLNNNFNCNSHSNGFH